MNELHVEDNEVPEEMAAPNNEVLITIKHFGNVNYGIFCGNELNGLVLMLEDAMNRIGHRKAAEPLNKKAAILGAEKLIELAKRV